MAWVNVNDRLPEENKRVVFFDIVPVHGRMLLYDDPDNPHYHDDYMISLRKVTHWQPLPEPPKEAE